MNKAHTATANRIARRYGLVYHPHARTLDSDPEAADLKGPGRDGKEIAIEVETSATLADAVKRLSKARGRFYIAVTNKEALIDAVRLTKDTPLGVMDPKGDIVKECAELSFPSLKLLESPEGEAAEVPASQSRRYTESVGAEPPARPPAANTQPIHAVHQSRAPAFAIPDAAALSGALPGGFGRDGAGLSVG